MKIKRSLLSILFILAVIFSLGAFPVGAEEYIEPTICTTDFEARQGEEFTTTIYIAKNSNIFSFQMALKYDTDIVTLTNAEANEDAGGLVVNTDVQGVIDLNYSRVSNLTSEKQLVDLTFKIDENAGCGTYDLFTIDDTVVKRAGTLVNNEMVAVNLNCDFAKLVLHDVGDVDLNGEVDIFDVSHIRRHLVQLETLTDFQLSLADAFYDGAVDVFDAVHIQRKLARYDVQLGNRVNIRFFDADGNLYATKSVVYGENLNKIPLVPAKSGYSEGSWSLKNDILETPAFNNVTKEIDVYAFYGNPTPESLDYYKEVLTTQVYSGDLPIKLADLSLLSNIKYQGNEEATIIWSSSNNSTLNASNGKYSKPTYDTELTLTATIYAYNNSVLEATDTIDFVYNVNGEFITPTKTEIVDWLNKFFEDGVNYNVKLPQKLSNADIKKESPYEVRISWQENVDGVLVPISTIERTTTARVADLVATITFNGKPLEDDGKVYIDNLNITAIEEHEVRSHIIQRIAENMGVSLTTGESLWNDDQVYGASVRWISGNNNIATIANNVVTISNATVSGTLLPLVAQVTYPSDSGAKTFELYYTVSAITSNATLVPGKNIDESLYVALKEATGTNGTLTTDALKAIDFVYLDLSKYPGIKDLAGLSYCTNLRVLNISGLRIEKNINQIATLSKLEALIARNCGLDNLSDGGAPVLGTAINLKLLDLSHNNFTTLDSVFAADKTYGKLMEVYLNDNNLQDISALKRAPAISVLALSNNGLTSDKIQNIESFKFLMYLSLADNSIDDISALKNLIYMEELRLQNNHITDIRPLKLMTDLKALYLGNNGINGDIDFLDYLTELRVLYLNDNNISDVSGLTSLENLTSINVSNNNIDSLSCLEKYSKNLKEVYAENNEIRSFAFVKDMRNLRVLMLSGNIAQSESSLTSYLCNLTNLETLTLSGKPISDLSFLSGMNNLYRLDLEGCDLPAYLVNSSSVVTDNASGEKTLEIYGFQDNVKSILEKKNNLKYLNISNNNMAYDADEIVDYMAEHGYAPGVTAIRFTEEAPCEIEALYELGKIEVLYMDNIHKEIDANKLTSLMTELKYLSMENCGITDISWLSKFRNLVYVDLANNSIDYIDLGTQISTKAKENLKYLYLDTNNPDNIFVNAYKTFDSNNLIELSLSGVNVNSMANMPSMEYLRYLNLSNTGITDIQGDDPDYYDRQSIVRYKNLRTLDVTGLDADMSAVLELPLLAKYYATATPSDRLFYKENIDTMYALYNKNVDCYLYSDNEKYEPVADKEGTNILNELPDISCAVTVAANNKFSTNNPTLVDQVNNYPITWTVSNNVNYEIVNNHLSVKDYSGIQDEKLIVTATISVYPTQNTVSRSFEIDTKILRGSSNYYKFDTTGLNGGLLSRNDEFTYSIEIKAAETEGFAEPVEPVVDTIEYKYSAVLANGRSEPYSNIMVPTGDYSYRIYDAAPLDSVTTIKVDVGHTVDDQFIVDDELIREFTIVGRYFAVTYVTNGGTVTASDGSEVVTENMSEDAVMFQNVSVMRTGYIFEGWFTDENCTELFSNGSDGAIMPSKDITLYAKWKAHSFNLKFDANGGTVSTESKRVLCDTPFGELPTPTRNYYNFLGWFTENGTQISSNDSLATADDVTVYAHWEQKPVKGWIKASELPTGAQVVNNKWSYTKTTTTESTNTSLSGYKQISSKWVQSGSGSRYYASFPSGFDTTNSIYTSFSKSPYSAYENTTNKRTVSNSRQGYVYWHWMYDTNKANGTSGRAIYNKKGTGANGYYYQYFGAFTSSTNYPSGGTGYTNNLGITNYIVSDRTSWSSCQGATRWFRFDYYKSSYVDYYKLFTYQKVENLESSSEVTASGTISNVVHWVQYRDK